MRWATRKTIIFAGLMLLSVSGSAFAGAAIDSGALDTTFGSSGKVQLAALAGDTTAVSNDTVVKPDGKILIAGYDADGAGNESWRVTRLNVDGSLDTTFSGGNVTLLDSTTVTRAQSIALLPDGRIIVAGTLSGSGIRSASCIV